MAAGVSEIREWVERGVKTGATHVIIVCDKWDYTDYPVYVEQNESVHEQLLYYGKAEMQKVMEVYNLSMDIESQLNESIAWHL